MNEQKPITLYGVMSPNVVKVAIMLEELNLPYVLRFVALFKGQQFTPEFRALSPLGKVPVITDPAHASSKTMQNASAEDLDRFFGRTGNVPAQDYSAVKGLK